jgi:hypothetical protein
VPVHPRGNKERDLSLLVVAAAFTGARVSIQGLPPARDLIPVELGILFDLGLYADYALASPLPVA